MLVRHSGMAAKIVWLLLFISAPFAATQCPNSSWVVEDDRIDGIVAVEGRSLKHVKVQLSSSVQKYSAVTDSVGRFLIPRVPVGSYAFTVKGWGKAHLDVKGWHRGGINRPVLYFNSVRGCPLLIQEAD
jgi:hypothetical protein